MYISAVRVRLNNCFYLKYSLVDGLVRCYQISQQFIWWLCVIIS